MLDSSKSSMIDLICFPPGPMTFPMPPSSIVKPRTLGTLSGSSLAVAAPASSIFSMMCMRASFACRRAFSMKATVRPSVFVSSWKVVMPVLDPATLKSMTPSASSTPIKSERTTLSSTGASLSFTAPMATPATTSLRGTPASLIARYPPQTLAMLLDPWLSVIRLSTLTVYGKSEGMARERARSARLPCPTSRRPTPPTLPVSPTEEGGNEYWR
mmetsp:Transcript_6414/g.12238  ORF Transcript_6414/g.12238 Transcript_6414/m.12238 type:complete len:214 (+) Transcript_6414:545-1186(+)